jgi:hypothetical protein
MYKKSFLTTALLVSFTAVYSQVPKKVAPFFVISVQGTI